MADLHYVIQTLYGWDNEHLHQFHIYGKDYGINYDGGLGYSDNADKVYFDDFAFDTGDKFTYEYNFFEHLMHDIRVENVEELIENVRTVSCIKGSGMPGVDTQDEIKLMTRLLRLILNETKSLVRAELVDLIDQLNAIKFNRKRINQQLNGLKEDHL